MARSNTSIYAALSANIAIAIAKFFAASVSKSASMAAEAIHSLVDCFNELLLLLGIWRSNKKRDKQHPFGYGRELYFWSFIVAILILGLGAGIAFFQGYSHLKNPTVAGNLKWNYIVLGFSMLFDGGSFLIALKAFNKTRGNLSLWEAIRDSKDPSNFMVLLEDGASVIGIIIVFTCLYLGDRLQNPYLDGIGSLCIGLLLAFISIILARESRSLLMGEGISPQTEKEIIDIVKKDETVNDFHRIFSIYQSPDEVLIVLIISFRDHLDTDDINTGIERIKTSITNRFSKINFIIIQPQAEEKIDDGFA
jgi:cation diffusion facilitator family transporter